MLCKRFERANRKMPPRLSAKSAAMLIVDNDTDDKPPPTTVRKLDFEEIIMGEISMQFRLF